MEHTKRVIKFLEIAANKNKDNFSETMVVGTKSILAITEAFRLTERRAEAAEAEVQRLNSTAQPVSDGCKVPKGWKLVPIEPTEEMMRQGFEEMSDSNDPELGVCLSSVYRRILEAAPGGQDD